MKRVIQMLILLIAMYLPSIVWSHQVVGNDRYDTPGKIAEIEKYFKERYNLELDRHVVVILEPSTKAYSRRLQSLKVKDYESIAYRSQALTSKENVIVIDCSGLSDRSYMFFLVHELVHQYQFQLLKEKTTEDMVAVEGLADIIASDISGYPIEIKNYKISYESIKSYYDFKSSLASRGSATIYQARFFMRNANFLDYLKKE